MMASNRRCLASFLALSITTACQATTERGECCQIRLARTGPGKSRPSCRQWAVRAYSIWVLEPADSHDSSRDRSERMWSGLNRRKACSPQRDSRRSSRTCPSLPVVPRTSRCRTPAVTLSGSRRCGTTSQTRRQPFTNFAAFYVMEGTSSFEERSAIVSTAFRRCFAIGPQRVTSASTYRPSKKPLTPLRPLLFSARTDVLCRRRAVACASSPHGRSCGRIRRLRSFLRRILSPVRRSSSTHPPTKSFLVPSSRQSNCSCSEPLRDNEQSLGRTRDRQGHLILTVSASPPRRYTVGATRQRS